MYKRREVAAREEGETSEIRERTSESIGARERRDVLCTSLCVVNRDCVITTLRSVVCYSTNVATESTVSAGLCGNPSALPSLSSRATVLL